MEEPLVYKGLDLAKPLGVSQLKYIVVGTGRCGTVYLAKLLSSVGLPCGHETVFQADGIDAALKRLNGDQSLHVSTISQLASIRDENLSIEWFGERRQIVADSSYLAAPFLDHEQLKDVGVIHIVRDPLKVINSFVAGFGYFQDDCLTRDQYREYHEFIYKYAPEVSTMPDPVSQAACYWVVWNEMIEAKVAGRNYLFYPVERSVDSLFAFLGLTVLPGFYYDNRLANHKLNLTPKIKYLNQIPHLGIRERLMKQASRYGYALRKMII